MSPDRATLSRGGFVRVFILVCLAALTGCASVEHIRLYREARQDFSDAARVDNVGTISRISPDARQIESMRSSVKGDFTAPTAPAPASSPGSAGEGPVQSYERWANVCAEFTALNSRAGRELAADQLLGSSQALQILAQARRDLYAQLMKLEGPSTPDLTAPPLTEAVAKANALMGNAQVQLFPRDAYLLRALEPVTRYEIAYVNACEAARRGTLTPDRIDQLVGQIAKAEQETESVAAAAGDARASILAHATMSRFLMLVAGEFLLQDKANLQLPLVDSELKAGARALGARVAHFRQQALAGDTAEHELFLRLGLEPTPASLTTWGVGKIVEEPTTQP